MDLSLVRAVESFAENHPDAYIGNGMIGYRIKPNPFVSWKEAASGFVKDSDPGRYETLAYAPYPFAMDFRLGDGPSASENSDAVTVLRQSLDMSCGEITTELEFPLGGGAARAEVLQFVSRTCPVAACQEVRLTVPESGELAVTASVGLGPCNSVAAGMLESNDWIVDLMLAVAPDDGRSRCGVSTKVDFGGAEVTREKVTADAPESRVFRLPVTAGQIVVIRTLAATVTSFYHSEPDLESCRLVNWAAALGFEKLRERNREAWASIWQSRVKITGDERAQRYLDASLYYVFSSAHESCRTSIAPFGLSQSMNYGGHVFWDTDTYITPVLMLVSPPAAKATVDYRLHRLDAAKKRAACFGYAGAMYPWESDTRGFESTPSNCATGWMEQHIPLCVAFAAWQYYLATGDASYLREGVWPIVRAVAEWVASRVQKIDHGCTIRDTMSSAEDVKHDDSSYVNGLAGQVMRAACECAALVGFEAPAEWAEIAEGMFVPTGPAPGVDGDIVYMYREGWEKYASVDTFMIGFPFDLPLDRDMLRRTFDFCMTLEQQNMTMGHAFFVGEAAFVEDREETRELFHRVIDELSEPVWGMGTEYTTANDTCFVTTMAGMLQSAMMAFTGLRFEPGNWTKYEACLPEGGERIEIDRVHLGGKTYRVVAEHGKKAELTEV